MSIRPTSLQGSAKTMSSVISYLHLAHRSFFCILRGVHFRMLISLADRPSRTVSGPERRSSLALYFPYGGHLLFGYDVA